MRAARAARGAARHTRMQLKRSSSSAAAEQVLFHDVAPSGAALVTLHRPKALNALNLHMIRQIYPRYAEYEEDAAVRCIVLEGAGGKAFCAGGDVRAIWEAGSGGETGRTFFREEYRLNHRIATLSVPHVALIHGITMGGGVGLSLHGKYRVATETTLFAMPETAIGLFPDVGGSIFLPKMGLLGRYLALTGARVKGRDNVLAGVATHYVASDKLEHLKQQLLLHADDVPGVLSEFAVRGAAENSSLQANREAIERVFAHDSVEEILQALQKEEDSEWKQQTLKQLQHASPTSLKVTLEQIKRGAQTESMEEAFRMEYRMAQRFMERPDFFEGVRAMLVDRDNSPSWSPKTLEEVTQEEVAAFFAPLPEGEELTFE